MSVRSARLTRALGAAAIAAVAVIAVGIADTAAPVTATADEEIATDLGTNLHGDPIPAAANWARAGTAFTVTAAAPQQCTALGAADDIANEVAQSGPKWHLVIAVPHDIWNNNNFQNAGQNLLAAHAVQSIKTIEAFHQARLGTGNIGEAPNQWSLRFDYGTTCGPQFPDISIYHLPKTQAQYTSEPFFGVVADLDASGLYERSNKRYLVHYAGTSIYCGQSYIYGPTDSAGGARYSITYNLHALALTHVTTALCDWTTDAHEMGHSMGAATGGPLNNDGAHTWDCSNDVMSYGGSVCGDGQLYFDWQENNYFNHSGSWNDTDQSAYWCKQNC